MTTRTWYYDREGRPLDARAWSALLTQPGYVMIAAEFVGPYFVSARWTGVDEPLDGDDGDPRPPMVFAVTAFDGRIPIEARRYPTEGAARAGYADVVRRLRRFRRSRTLSLVVIGLSVLAAVGLLTRWWS